MEKPKSKSAKFKKTQKQNKREKGENRKVKKGKDGETMDLSICLVLHLFCFFDLLICSFQFLSFAF